MNKKIIISLILMIGSLSMCLASYSPKSGEIGLRGGVVVFEGDSDLQDSGFFGVSFGHYLSNPLEIEFCMLGGKTDTSLGQQDLNVFIPTVEALYHFGDYELRPFVAMGGGFMNLNYAGSNQDRIDFAVPLGGGVKWFFYPNLTARADCRYLLNTQAGKGTHNALFSLGLSVLFGEGVEMVEREPVVAVRPPEPPRRRLDSDEDGVPDEKDACPGTMEDVAVNEQGCPLDSDSDGIPDFKDQCPGTASGTSVEANGCPQQVKELAVPEEEWVLSGIQFEKMSDRLTPSSRQALDKAAEILLAHPNVRVEIQGYTDSFGRPALNLKLSARRAERVKKYLIQKGVAPDRLISTGYGESRPRFDNRTPEGREKNRRIEFKVLSR